MSNQDFLTFNIKYEPIVDTYDIDWDCNLGCGVNGPVRSCTNKSTGVKYALKCLIDRTRSRHEAQMHRLCSWHQNIVKLEDVYSNDIAILGETRPRKRLLLVMEIMDGGELFDEIAKNKYFTERQAAQYTLQICKAIEVLHSYGIAHRDIKPENLLLKDKPCSGQNIHIKLSDFGFAKFDDGTLKTPSFTPYYVAPQVLKAEKDQLKAPTLISCITGPKSPYTYDKSCDMWSLGVLIYIMLCGYPPFYSEVRHKSMTHRMKKNIIEGQFDFPQEDWQHISSSAKTLIKNLLIVDPIKRLTIHETLNCKWLYEGPATVLMSPAIMLNTEIMEDIKQEHSEQLTTMRTPDICIRLKALDISDNHILRRRAKTKLTTIAEVT